MFHILIPLTKQRSHQLIIMIDKIIHCKSMVNNIASFWKLGFHAFLTFFPPFPLCNKWGVCFFPFSFFLFEKRREKFFLFSFLFNRIIILFCFLWVCSMSLLHCRKIIKKQKKCWSKEIKLKKKFLGLK